MLGNGDNMDEQEKLSNELTTWQIENGLPLQCAFEQSKDEFITKEQREFLLDFCNRWDEVNN